MKKDYFKEYNKRYKATAHGRKVILAAQRRYRAKIKAEYKAYQHQQYLKRKNKTKLSFILIYWTFIVSIGIVLGIIISYGR